MRVLWVARESVADGGTIYDQKVRSALEEQFEIHALTLPRKAGAVRHVASSILNGVPHDRARYACRGNADLVQAEVERLRPAAVVLSHESLDWIAPRLSAPTVLLLHNLTSGYAHHLARGAMGLALADAYAAYERRTYKARDGLALVCLSALDENILQKRTRARIFRASPGMPKLHRLAPNSPPSNDLAVAGTFEWRLKAKGLMDFAAEYRRAGACLRPMFAEPPRSAIREQIADWRLLSERNPETLGFGLVTDRFEAGFKLKVGAHIAENLITLSYADVSGDYQGLTNAREFIVRVNSIADIDAAMSRAAEQHQQGLISRFEAFKIEATQRFTWRRASEAVMEAISAARAAGRVTA